MEKHELLNETNYIEQVFKHNLGINFPNGLLEFNILKGNKNNFYFDFTVTELDFKNEMNGIGRFIKKDKKIIVTILESFHNYETNIQTISSIYRHQVTKKNDELILENSEGEFYGNYYSSSRLVEKVIMPANYTIDELICLPNVYEEFAKKRNVRTLRLR